MLGFAKVEKRCRARQQAATAPYFIGKYWDNGPGSRPRGWVGAQGFFTPIKGAPAGGVSPPRNHSFSPTKGTGADVAKLTKLTSYARTGLGWQPPQGGGVRRVLELLKRGRARQVQGRRCPVCPWFSPKRGCGAGRRAEGALRQTSQTLHPTRARGRASEHRTEIGSFRMPWQRRHVPLRTSTTRLFEVSRLSPLPDAMRAWVARTEVEGARAFRAPPRPVPESRRVP